MTADEGLPPADVLGRLENLSRALDGVAARLQEVSISGRQTRRLAVGLAVSFALDIVLTVVVTMLSLSALSQGATIHASQLSACSIGNQTRVQEQQLWAYLFQLGGGVKTPQQRQALAYIQKTFAPVDCAALYKN
jgi:hypothetical protein